jgi:hypothetical protein
MSSHQTPLVRSNANKNIRTPLASTQGTTARDQHIDSKTKQGSAIYEKGVTVLPTPFGLKQN